MSDYKFDTFYYTEDQSNEHFLSEIENLPDEDYIASYKGKMYCPWCKGPKLTLVHSNKGNSFLRIYQKQKHIVIEDELCPYDSYTASDMLVKTYIQELKEKKKIKSLLESTMRKFRRSKGHSFQYASDFPCQVSRINIFKLQYGIIFS